MLRRLTADLAETYAAINPAFTYDGSRNPRRALTKPCQPVGNDGHDNANGDLIVHVNQIFAADTGDRFRVEDLQGKGAFGYVYRCRRLRDGAQRAIKVVKNKPAYFNQALAEIGILKAVRGRARASPRAPPR